MIKKLMPLYMVVLMVLSLALIYGCGSAPTSGGGGGGGGTTTYTLSVTVTPDVTFGTVEASPNLDNWTYLSGTTVELTASGIGGKIFSSWEGGATGATSPTHVTMTANKSVKAYFRDPTSNHYLLSVTATPSAGGTVEVTPLAADYADGTVVALTAEAAVGYSFSHWTGSLEGSISRETITMNGTKEVTAVFTPIVSTDSYFGVVTGLYDQLGTNCLTDMLISTDVVSTTFYLDARNGVSTIHGTWSLLSDGFSSVESSSSTDFNTYFYNNPIGVVFAANSTSGGSAIIWSASSTGEPVLSGDTYNVMLIKNVNSYDWFLLDNQPTYFRFSIAGSGGSYTNSFNVYQFNGTSFLSNAIAMSYNDNKYLFGSTPAGGGTMYMRCNPSPSNMLVGSVGNDTDHYEFVVGGKALTFHSGDLNGKHFVGLMMSSSETQYLAGLGGASNQIDLKVIADPGSSSDYSGPPDATITLGTEKQTGVLGGTVSIGGNTYACDTIVTKVGTSENKYMVAGLVSKEAIGSGSWLKSENFFLIEK